MRRSRCERLSIQKAAGPGFCSHTRRAPLNRDRRPRSGWQGLWIDLDDPVAQPHPVGLKLLGERGRRTTVLEAILVAVPRAGDEPVRDAAFAERTVLVRAEIGQRADLVAVTEHRDALAVRGDDDA